ncbi:type IX secretion system membrane protein, PorP/SprF family [Cnuella takakiae]|uniref:Type IX secretion system membrane protein, PorP/SprF family n=2 Tax=Cnuella takakiae TaxID=1302690 RepID=A0A1M4T9D7_9BACT|nr:type IX secretion system membrane protein, PorP/SprF family [Cnuella takakiae]
MELGNCIMKYIVLLIGRGRNYNNGRGTTDDRKGPALDVPVVQRYAGRFQPFAIGLVCCTIVQQAAAQDINFSQFYELPLLRNPALAGNYKGDVRATSAFRSQWGSVSTPYQTVALGTEVKFGVAEFSNDYISIGAQITNDIAGDSRLGRTQFLPLLAYHKSVNEDRDAYLTAGFLGGMVQQRFDPTKLSFDDQFVNGAYSPTNPTRQTFSNTNVTYWDAAAGLSYSSVLGYDTRYYVGASYFHFTQPKVAFARTSDIRLNKKYVLNAGLSVATSEFDRLILYADYFMQGGNRQGQGGALFKHDLLQEDEDQSMGFSVGAFYRWNDAVVPVVKLDLYKLAIGLTYDVNVSKLRTASQFRGGFELTVSYKSFLNIRNSSAAKVRCPADFY